MRFTFILLFLAFPYHLASPLYFLFNTTNGDAILTNAPYTKIWWRYETSEFRDSLKFHNGWLDLFHIYLTNYHYDSSSPDNALLQLQKEMTNGVSIVPATAMWRNTSLFSTQNFNLYCYPTPSCLLSQINNLQISLEIALRYVDFLLDN